MLRGRPTTRRSATTTERVSGVAATVRHVVRRAFSRAQYGCPPLRSHDDWAILSVRRLGCARGKRQGRLEVPPAGSEAPATPPCVTPPESLMSPHPSSRTVEPINLTVPEAAALLRMGKNEVYARVAAGHIPAMKVGRKLLLPVSLLRRYAEEQALGASGASNSTLTTHRAY